MKILVVTYSYPPDLTPRAFRWSAVAENLARSGHEVHVLCATGSKQQLPEDGVVVHRVRDWLLDASVRVSAGGAAGMGGATAGPKSRWRGAMRQLVRALWRSLHWPDYACGWVIPGARAARALCAMNRYDWIISVSHPFSGHLVALLARRAVPQARWFVDIGDPFHLMKEPSPNNRRLFSWLNRRIETYVLSAADAISVTTDSTLQMYESFFALPSGKVQVIPPLLSLPAAPHPSRPANDTALRLVFVGTLYRRLRSPRFLLACFSELQAVLPERRLELHFYGAINDCADEFSACHAGTAKAVFTHGMVGRAEVLQAMVDADVLVNIGNDSEAQLASKVIEYMAVGKPILNLTSSPADTSLVALVDYPAVLNIQRTGAVPEPACVAALRDFVRALPVVPAQAAEAVRQRYSAAYVSGCYETILKNNIVSR